MLAGLLACAASGCGPSGPKMVPVSGEVTFNGKPVETGDILFMPAEGHAAPEGGRIVNGRYECTCVPGKKRVEVRATREIPGTSDSMRGGRPRVEDYVPRQFNVDTTLTADVPAAGSNSINFPLTGPGAKVK
ncbi:hypothetical protein FRUB_06676 [Fimbriiglobus ruber]|uniref:Lipoprotein n=1 Tax=Fimbriiglobus ruber TaxID=1908690 RepID=A0A225DJE7_9BACT|nr:hypothetical protein FRUB_06676 [Fimbriiglobus ruber]